MTADNDRVRNRRVQASRPNDAAAGRGCRPSLVLVLGGVRSGKSGFAASLARQMGERVAFIATAEAGDDEMRARIERHRSKRPQHWLTIEAPTAVGEAFGGDARDCDVAVIDCLGLLLSNAMGRAEQTGTAAEDAMELEVTALLDAFGRGSASLIVVSNEVGMGVVPPYPAGREFRDVLGRANQRLAQAADRVYWMVAGLPIELKASGMAQGMELTDGIA